MAKKVGEKAEIRKDLDGCRGVSAEGYRDVLETINGRLFDCLPGLTILNGFLQRETPEVKLDFSAVIALRDTVAVTYEAVKGSMDELLKIL